MKLFSKALLLAAIVAQLTDAKKGKMFEANAYVTPKRENSNQADPYLKQNLLNLRQTKDNDSDQSNNLLHDITHFKKEEDLTTHIVSTSDIENYFNL